MGSTWQFPPKTYYMNRTPTIKLGFRTNEKDRDLINNLINNDQYKIENKCLIIRIIKITKTYILRWYSYCWIITIGLPTIKLLIIFMIYFQGSILGQVIPKTQKIVLNAALLNIQHYKVRIKGKVEQSSKWSSALSYTLV